MRICWWHKLLDSVGKYYNLNILPRSANGIAMKPWNYLPLIYLGKSEFSDKIKNKNSNYIGFFTFFFVIIPMK